MFKSYSLPYGEKINAFCSGNNLMLYIADGKRVYFANLVNFKSDSPYLDSPPKLFFHCDEICAFSDGRYLTRKNDRVNLCGTSGG
ncbi:MAG: hypothetical protein PHE12_01970 [Clostridia bacterium]|nr:hypothetical protein [Clostridia bacterium]